MRTIENYVKDQLRFTNSVKFGISVRDIPKVKKYFTEKGYNIELIAKSKSIYGISLKIKSFKYYTIVKKK